MVGEVIRYERDHIGGHTGGKGTEEGVNRAVEGNCHCEEEEEESHGYAAEHAVAVGSVVHTPVLFPNVVEGPLSHRERERERERRM